MEFLLNEMEKQPKYDNIYYFPIEDWKLYVLMYLHI